MIETQTTAEDRTSDHALGVPRHPIRPCTMDDIPWLLERVAEHYGDQAVDLKKAETYWRQTIGRRDHVYIRGARSAGASRLVRPYWAADSSPPGATDLFFFADKEQGGVFEIIMIMRVMIEWASKCGCSVYKFSAMTGVDVSTIAKRLGATTSHSIYQVPLKAGA